MCITKNQNFNNLHYLFEMKEWTLEINEWYHLLYIKKERETEYFEIKIYDNNKISVSVPLQNSIFQYKTIFYDYYKTNEYLKNYLLFVCI